jgi:carbon monoxide dehydrogenase subunit G
MELTNEFGVSVPVARAWEVLTDVELIAPCMPGAQLQEIEGDEYRGVVKVKVGPITAQYKGAARFLEKDEAAHKAVLRAEGRDTRGQGNANATITAELAEEAGGTKVTVTTDLTITGRVAQFGRGVLADVSGKLLGQFVDCLESKLLTDEGATGSSTGEASSSSGGSSSGGSSSGPRDIASEGAAATLSLEDLPDPAPAPTATASPAGGTGGDETARLNGTSGPAVRVVQGPDAEPVDLLDAAGAPVAKRVAPAVVGLTILWLLSVFFRRRRRRRKAA